MMNHFRKSNSSLKNEKGQVALFVALAFQILFLFFAMVINVGLLVHHKINLQNAVDLAAYYGASKQAEDMDVIAHTNYQIRQSWKLLVWRYRMLGQAGDTVEHPYNKSDGTVKYANGLGDVEGINPQNADWYNAPSFCISYTPFREKITNEDNCKNNASSVNLFKIPPVIFGLGNISQAVQNLSTSLRSNAVEACGQFGANNYLQLARFAVGYNFDQANRLNFIKQLANDMSSSTSDFYDIDGQSVSTGVQTTLLNNLTAANRNGGPNIKVYNSLGDPNCGSTGSSNAAPQWLSTVNLFPGFAYIDFDCAVTNSTSITPIPTELTSALPRALQNGGTYDTDQIIPISKWVGYSSDPSSSLNYSIGVEKNPWCMAYVGVSASTTPSIPFSPFSAVTLTARSFAKPFGGRIGPWYSKQWDRGNTSSNTTSTASMKTDPLLPPRMINVSNAGNPADPTRSPNYSRFVGDAYGLKTRNVYYQYGRGIFGLATPYANYPPLSQNQNFADQSPAFAHWEHLPFIFEATGQPDSGDLLAWNSESNVLPRMRYLEVSAILPDTFDMAYYSIEPDFYHKYYTRVKSGYLAGPGKALSTPFYPDLGYHAGYNNGGLNLNEFAVKDQILMAMSIVPSTPNVLKNLGLDFLNKLTYLSRAWPNVLTGWSETTLATYDTLDPDFGTCEQYPVGVTDNGSGNGIGTANPPTSGNCQVGGRSGYAVKIISSDFLAADMQNLGGQGSSGTILNPPPSSF